MKRVLLFFAVSFLLTVSSNANHITGGEMFYTLTSQTGNSFSYRVTLKLYRDCFSSGAQLDENAGIGIFERSSGAMVWNQSIPRIKIETLTLGSPGPCITNPPPVCYEVGYYEFDITLPGIPSGYIISYQRCCRIAGINNLENSSAIGATYTAEIPGTSPSPTAPANNSARFVGADTVIVCADNAFSYSFGAVDNDPQDILSYSYCNAYTGGTSGSPAPNPPQNPPYLPVDYAFTFNAGTPLGPSITINPATGLLSGIAPAPGIYVVTVCVTETRNGVIIATQRKDLQIKVGDCEIAKAALDPEYMSCDGFTQTFQNNNSSPLINSWYWEFGDPASGANNSSNIPNPTHTFTVAGDYTIKLVTNRNQECSDSTTAVVKVYPGFFPEFRSAGICITNPVLFEDQTTTNFGVVDSWSWSFGEVPGSSTVQNPSFNYTSTGPKNVSLTVTNSKGCKKTISKVLNIIDKPPITLAFKDTLICIPDPITLQATGTGNFSWTPSANMTNPNTGSPTVSPITDTWYYVNLNEQGCLNRDSVRVRVVSFVTLQEMGDTVICATDEAQLRVSGDGLKYEWAPVPDVNDPFLQNPVAIAGITNTYTVTARIGTCSAQRDINVLAIPYPIANAGPPFTICYNVPAQMNGSHNGSSFTWSPTNYLSNPSILNPLVNPPRTTEYILSSFDNLGCPKPGRDTVVVTLLPKILPFAGRDTSVIVGQPLQFNAEGGTSYLWTPPVGLSSTNIHNPIGTYDGSIDSVRYTVEVFNEEGCSDSAFITVKIFKTLPSIFVPSGFTPNNDGLNDIISPIAVGMQQINYFRIYNRWGQLVFSTTRNGHGWDGRINGVPQATNSYVWLVSAVDFLGKPYFQKGTVTLIR